MGKYSKSFFENPYLEEGSDQTKYSAEVIMDEARQKWRVGNWRARSEAFELDRSELTSQNDAEGQSAEGTKRPPATRFRIDIHRDLTNDSISRSKLQELDYSPSYRPKGDIEERMIGPRSTLQRYDVLAGELEAPPEDISFVSDADARREREQQKGSSRTGQLRRDTRRLESSVDERRSELIKMLPDDDGSEARRIVKESSARRRREDAEIGRVRKNKVRYRFTHEDDLPEGEKSSRRRAEEVSESDLAGTRMERLPQQTGMGDSSVKLPEFATEARYWSQIKSEKPSWSEVAAHSVNTVPKEEEPRELDGRYIRPDDDRSEYAITPTRARVRSTEAGEFKNEYLSEANIDRERIKQIMNHHYRGRWIPPEFFADDALVEDYFNALSSGQTGGEDFVTWAYRRKQAEEHQRQMAERARREYMRAIRTPHTGRRRSPFMQPPAPRRPMSREEMLRQYEQARKMGYQQGSAMNARRKKSTQQPVNSPYAVYGAPPYGMAMPYPTPNGAVGQYQGMYPELFEGTDPQPQHHYQPQQPVGGQEMPMMQGRPTPYGAPPQNMPYRQPVNSGWQGGGASPEKYAQPQGVRKSSGK